MKKLLFALFLLNTSLNVIANPSENFSLYNSIQKKTEVYEKVSLIAFEGSSLTLLGLVKYDPVSDTIKMTNVSGIVAGGFKECKKIIENKI